MSEPGQYVTSDIAGEPVVIVRGNDDVLRGFFNVCRHHAAAVMTEPEGKASAASLSLSRLDLFAGRRVERHAGFLRRLQFRSSENGLVPVELADWENWVFVKFEQRSDVA